MRPRAASSELIEQIGSRLRAGEARPWADRCLMSAIGAGAAAACVIVSILVGEGSQSAGRTPGSPAVMNATVADAAPRFGDYPLAFARIGGDVPGASTAR